MTVTNAVLGFIAGTLVVTLASISASLSSIRRVLTDIYIELRKKQ